MAEPLKAMPEATVRRTLVKSPPELWAEVSDAAALARHLGEFGEIRITRTDPETTVAWEGDRARGTVELEASGWGTKVTLTAEPAAEPVTHPESVPDVEVVAEEPVAVEMPEPVTEPEPVIAPEPAAVVEPEPVAVAPAHPEPEPDPEPVAPPAPTKRPGFFARLFGRRAAPTPAPAPVAEEPPAPALTPVADPEPEAAPPAEVVPLVTPSPVDPPEPPAAAEVDPEPVVTDAPAPLDADRVEEILVGVLDDLGAAHHRPFSRS